MAENENLTKLVSTDVDTEDGRYCPKCGADWRASQIPIGSVQRGSYGHKEPCQKKRKWDDDYNEATSCTCPPRFYSHLIGIETAGYDGVSLWMCPVCCSQWNRWTRMEVSNE